MKKRIIFIAVIAALLLLIGFRYAVVERNDILPEEVRFGLSNWLGMVSAEVETDTPAEPAPTSPDAQPEHTETPVTKESSAETAEDFFIPEEEIPGEEISAESGEAEPSGAETSEEAPEDQPVLKKGDRGEEVKALQQRLRELGFLTGKADGIFGAKTEQAVIEFKSHLYELAQEELARLQAEAERRAAEENAGASPSISPEITPRPTDSTEEAPAKPEFTGEVDDETHYLISSKGFDEYQGTLRLNARGAEVKRLQSKLRALGYLTGKADGIYGRNTQLAVSAFQKRHKLTEDGVAGEKTQRALFSASAKQQVKPEPTAKPSSGPSPRTRQQGKNGKYLLEVSTKDQKVYAYAWSDKDGAYTKLARTMVCSTGLPDTPTPKGTFKSVGPVVEWGYFPKYDVWAQYLFRIKGPYLFHSVLFDEADESTVKWGSINKLGSPASHGCIRLKVEDAKWIYKNCAAGTTVTVY